MNWINNDSPLGIGCNHPLNWGEEDKSTGFGGNPAGEEGI